MMPGPISDSIPEVHDVDAKEWRQWLRENGFKYFVLKAEDFLSALDADQVDEFNMMLKAHELYRVKRGKSMSNAYWVVNRDEPYADQVKALIFPEVAPAGGGEST